MSRSCPYAGLLQRCRPSPSTCFRRLPPSAVSIRRVYHSSILRISPLRDQGHRTSARQPSGMSRRHTTKSSKPSTFTTPRPTASSSAAHKHDGHDHSHSHDHDHHHHHGIFHTHIHDHSEGAEKIINAFRSGKVDRGTRITLIGPHLTSLKGAETLMLSRLRKQCRPYCHERTGGAVDELCVVVGGSGT